jgi:hypothetical protein
VHVYAISVMVPWFDSIAYNAVMCSLPRFYGNEGIQPDIAQTTYFSAPSDMLPLSQHPLKYDVLQGNRDFRPMLTGW